MVEVIQADREAAAALIKEAPLVDNPDMIIHKGADDGGFIQAFAAHRIQSTADLQAKLDMAVEALEKSRDTFKRYGDLHSAKKTRDADQKAAVNWALSMDMDEALAAIKGAKA